MAKQTPKTTTKPKAKKAKAAVKIDPAAEHDVDMSSSSRHPLARRRALAAVVIGVVVVMTIGGGAIWRLVAPLVVNRDRYLLQADAITISDLPEWIVGDVRRQVVESAGIAGRLSVLDPIFLTTIQHAFALHPWVESVERIEKQYPPAVFVQVKYRRPVAVVEVPVGESAELVPVDSRGIHLPADDVPLIRRTYLPRITGIAGQPPVGQVWDDPRVAGAIDLAVRLADQWEALNLTNIVPSARVKVEDDSRYFTYDLLNRGGTRIEWGPAPQSAPPGEDAFPAKLGRLKSCVAQYSTLDWFQWPKSINIRHGIEVTPREAKRKPQGNEPVVAANPPVVATKPEDETDGKDAVVK